MSVIGTCILACVAVFMLVGTWNDNKGRTK